MRAIHEIAADPVRVGLYISSTTLTLGAGRYKVVVCAGGGGAATAGFTTDTTDTEKTGIWGSATGGGGAGVSAEFVLESTSTATITVGDGGTGTQVSKVEDSTPASDLVAQASNGEKSEFTCGNVHINAQGGGGGYVKVTRTGSVDMVRGKGGMYDVSGCTNVAAVLGGDGEAESVYSIAKGTAQDRPGGFAGVRIGGINARMGAGAVAHISYIGSSYEVRGASALYGAVALFRL